MAFVVQIKPGQLAAMLKGNVKRQRRAIERGIERGMHRGRALLVKETPVDQGLMKNAWKVVTRDWATTALATNAIENDAPHAGIVERGARAHWAPLEPLARWVKRHLKNLRIKQPRFKKFIGPLTQKATTRRENRLAEFESEVMGAAVAIRNKIAKVGQKGTYFVRKSLPRLNEILRGEIGKALIRAMKGQGAE